MGWGPTGVDDDVTQDPLVARQPPEGRLHPNGGLGGPPGTRRWAPGNRSFRRTRGRGGGAGGMPARPMAHLNCPQLTKKNWRHTPSHHAGTKKGYAETILGWLFEESPRRVRLSTEWYQAGAFWDRSFGKPFFDPHAFSKLCVGQKKIKHRRPGSPNLRPKERFPQFHCVLNLLVFPKRSRRIG